MIIYILPFPFGQKADYRKSFHYKTVSEIVSVKGGAIHLFNWKLWTDHYDKQLKIYSLALKKRNEAVKLGMEQSFKCTTDELNSMDYFNGSGSYEKFQNPSVPPNIFDNPKSLKIKMKDPKYSRYFDSNN